MLIVTVNWLSRKMNQLELFVTAVLKQLSSCGAKKNRNLLLNVDLIETEFYMTYFGDYNPAGVEPCMQ